MRCPEEPLELLDVESVDADRVKQIMAEQVVPAVTARVPPAESIGDAI
jgi:hypothetical protein